MPRGGAGNMLGVGGTRRTMGREALRGGGRGHTGVGAPDPLAHKRELLRGLRAEREAREEAEAEAEAEVTEE
ncbi:DUF6243 family protein [Streptomyces sp. NPDC052077]|uniref:DUF6243 family protein n=1 Tax=Streptomyces sp. NPDC052077 TaxID=3154757 RepID=UPI003421C082